MGDLEMISPTKKERLKRQAKLKRREEMRAALPMLTREEIRRFRVPYHEAILVELAEEGFPSTVEFLKQLLQYQADLIREHGPDSAVAARPELLSSKAQLDELYLGLKHAEAAHYADDVGTECDHLIKLAISFGLGSQDWWWLGEQLLIQAVNVTSTYQKDGKRREALARYINGKFILENISAPLLAKDELAVARQLSMGQHWSAGKDIGYKQDSIFVESCKLLYQALLIEAKEVMHHDPLKAARICAIARKRATDACDHTGEAEILMLQGICEMNGGEASAAVTSFNKALIAQTKLEEIEGICEARIQLALAYLKTGKFPQALEQLEKLLEFTEENDLLHYTAQAYRYLGEYYLNQGSPYLATPTLIKAFSIFEVLKVYRDIHKENASNLAAVSSGQELMPKYIDLILNCGKEGFDKIPFVLQLVDWKDTRKRFWEEVDDSSGLGKSISSIDERVKRFSKKSMEWKGGKGDEKTSEKALAYLAKIKKMRNSSAAYK